VPSSIFVDKKHFLLKLQFAPKTDLSREPDFHLMAQGRFMRRANSSTAIRRPFSHFV
jgi:hypothetical protein